jgi:hypothetical protein
MTVNTNVSMLVWEGADFKKKIIIIRRRTTTTTRKENMHI